MGEVKLTAKFSVGDEVVRIAGGEWFGLQEGDSATVVEVIDTPQNWHQIRLEGYQGLYSDFNFRLDRATTPTDQADHIPGAGEMVVEDQAELEVVATVDLIGEAIYGRHERGFVMWPLVDGDRVKAVLTEQLSQVTTLLAEKDEKIRALMDERRSLIETKREQIERLTRERDEAKENITALRLLLEYSEDSIAGLQSKWQFQLERAEAAEASLAKAVEVLIDAKIWHEEQDKSLSKQPPSSGPNGNQWARLQHREQIDLIDAFLSEQKP